MIEKPKLLTPAQAKAVWEAMSEPVDEALMGNMHLNDVWAEMELRLAALTIKPPAIEHCGGCEDWSRGYTTDGQKVRYCGHPSREDDPDVGVFLWDMPPPKVCPRGRRGE